MHTLALLLFLFAQEPKTETITIPGTDLKFEMVYVPGGRGDASTARRKASCSA